MGLSQALSLALSGLHANQSALSLISSNVANAQTPGYVRKTTSLVETSSAGGTGVSVAGVNRELDKYVQAQLWTETSGAGYASTKSNVLNSLQSVYGDPSSATSLEGLFNTLKTSLQALSTSPDDSSARTAVINSAQALAGQLNYATQGIQSLRASAESGINSAVSTANTALQQIAKINQQLQGANAQDASSATLLDQRDQYISQLSQTLDIRVVQGDNNQVSIYTGSGVQLVGTEAATLTFNAQGTVTPNTLYDPNPAKSNLGTLAISFPNGGSLDLISTGAVKSGSIGAYLELRDKTLVQAQNQVDQFAGALSSALSDKTTNLTPDAAGAYGVDTSTLQPGNTIHITYTDNVTGKQHNVSIVGVNDPSVLPLTNASTADPNDEVVGVDLSGGTTSIAAQLNAALGPTAHLLFTNPSGTTLQVQDDGASGRSDVNAVSTTTTVTSLTSGNVQLPLFTDGSTPYTGVTTASGNQATGYAGRITVNPALLADPSRLIVYSTSPQTAAGDTSRSDFILSQLTSGTSTFSPSSGVGSASTPFSGTLLSFVQQFTSLQGNAATSAQQVSDGQNVVVNTLQNKFSASSGVDIDEELANLLALQNAYSANARVISTVNSLFQSLLQSV
ncbi:MAG: flagellar hook-associated protein FlgK [Xanthobacteraceae bacterium]|nr:flagellar hook-associated protein FlgK [Xanthobacteraceae bacterium]